MPTARKKQHLRITHKGLFESRMMLFGVMNAPAMFQRLMQRVLAGLKTECGKEFVSVYLDYVIIFFRNAKGSCPAFENGTRSHQGCKFEAQSQEV